MYLPYKLLLQTGMGSSAREWQVVRVSSKGQATIPQPLREKFGIDSPGRVRFRENDQGEIVVEPVPHPSQTRGVFASDEYEEGEVWDRLDEMNEREREREAAELQKLREERGDE